MAHFFPFSGDGEASPAFQYIPVMKQVDHNQRLPWCRKETNLKNQAATSSQAGLVLNGNGEVKGDVQRLSVATLVLLSQVPGQNSSTEPNTSQDSYRF